MRVPGGVLLFLFDGFEPLHDEVVQIPLAQADGLQDVFPAALEGLVLHLDHRIPVIGSFPPIIAQNGRECKTMSLRLRQ